MKTVDRPSSAAGPTNGSERCGGKDDYSRGTFTPHVTLNERVVTPRKKNAALFSRKRTIESELNRVFGAKRRAELAEMVEMSPAIITQEKLAEQVAELQEIEVMFATWGMYPLTAQDIELLPKLQAVFYAGGSVRHFAPALLERGITVVSAWAANAVPVAEFTLAQILLANKGYWRNVGGYRAYREGNTYEDFFRGCGNFGATVSILGVGQIGRKLIELLCPFRLRVLVFDPFLTNEEAMQLRVQKVELDEAFARGNVISNHLADVRDTANLLNSTLFNSMPQNATFINTGRGGTVAHGDLVTVLRRRADLTALLDVTEPEPLPSADPLRELPNVHLTAHIAGSIGDEVDRMVQTTLEEFRAWRDGHPLRFEITPERLRTMA
jgi:phosphoglycerate dehydrogenase-like enzyme